MKFDIVNPAAERYTIEAEGRHAALYASAAITLIGEGHYALRHYGKMGLDAVVCPPFALSGNVGVKVWWNSVREPGMPEDLFAWLETESAKRGVADALDSVRLEGIGKSIAVDMVKDAHAIAFELRSKLGEAK